ncbi:MAG: hypothetical protein B7X95_05335 [Methylophilaceae bacterium 17-44-8]|nr:MAG: hypothetical protein B7X95_05335 [Methylophilaceae bacterium 17-44-8]
MIAKKAISSIKKLHYSPNFCNRVLDRSGAQILTPHPRGNGMGVHNLITPLLIFFDKIDLAY